MRKQTASEMNIGDIAVDMARLLHSLAQREVTEAHLLKR